MIESRGVKLNTEARSVWFLFALSIQSLKVVHEDGSSMHESSVPDLSNPSN